MSEKKKIIRLESASRGRSKVKKTPYIGFIFELEDGERLEYFLWFTEKTQNIRNNFSKYILGIDAELNNLSRLDYINKLKELMDKDKVKINDIDAKVKIYKGCRTIGDFIFTEEEIYVCSNSIKAQLNNLGVFDSYGEDYYDNSFIPDDYSEVWE